MRSIVVVKLMGHSIVDAPSVVAHALSPAGRSTLIDGSGWELLYDVVEYAVNRAKDAQVTLRSAERRHSDLSRDGLDDQAVLAAEERVAECKQAHDDVRREMKAVFANLFASACTVLGEAEPSTPMEADPEWRRVCIGHVQALGRRHRNEFSLTLLRWLRRGRMRRSV